MVLRNKLLHILTLASVIAACGCQKRSEVARVQVYIDLPRVLSEYGQPVKSSNVTAGYAKPKDKLAVVEPAVQANLSGAFSPVDDNTAMGYEARTRLDRLTQRLRKLEDSALADERHRLERLAYEEYGPESERIMQSYYSRLSDIIARHRPILNQTRVNDDGYKSLVSERTEFSDLLLPKQKAAEGEFAAALQKYEEDSLQASIRTRDSIVTLNTDLQRQIDQEMTRLAMISDSRVQSQSVYALVTQQENPWKSEAFPSSIEQSSTVIAMPMIIPKQYQVEKSSLQDVLTKVVIFNIKQLADRKGWDVAWKPGKKRTDVTPQVITMLKGEWK